MTTKSRPNQKPIQVRYFDGTKAEGEYDYRDFRVVRNDRERGYSGHWNAKKFNKSTGSFTRYSGMTRARVLADIDAHYNKAAPTTVQ